MKNIPAKAERIDAKPLTRRATLYLVLQEGGSSVEHYATLYNTERKALAAGRGHRRATYSATDPIPVVTHFDQEGKAFIAEDALTELAEAIRGAEYY